MSEPESTGDLLRQVGVFMRRTARALEAMRVPARALRQRLARTTNYRQVDGRDNACQEPTWDLAATLEVMLEDDLERMTDYLERDSRRAYRAARAADEHH